MGSLPLLLFLLLFSSSVSSPFPLTLPLQYMSLAIPPSFSLKQKSWLPSYLKPPCSNANHDQKKQEFTFPWLVAIFSASLLPHGFGRVMYLPASKQRVAWAIEKKKQQRVCFTLPWVGRLEPLTPYLFRRFSSRLSYHACVCVYTQPVKEFYKKG